MDYTKFAKQLAESSEVTKKLAGIRFTPSLESDDQGSVSREISRAYDMVDRVAERHLQLPLVSETADAVKNGLRESVEKAASNLRSKGRVE